MSLKAKIEAVIYASEEPVTLAQLTGLLGQEGQAELDALAAQQHSLALEDEQAADDADIEPIEDADALNAETTNPSEIPTTEPNAADLAPETLAAEEPEPNAPTAKSETSEPATDEKKLARDVAAATRLREAEQKLAARKLRDYFRELVDQLIADYANGDRGLEIREVAGGFRLGTKAEYHDAVRGFVKSLKPPLKLTLQALETLAVVAYKQPVTAPEVSEIRGVDSAGVLGSLLTRKLVTTAGRKQVIGRPILYKTTKDFLLRFGLKDINELPSIEEFEKMAGELNETLLDQASETEAQEEIAMDPTTHAPSPTTAAPLKESFDDITPDPIELEGHNLKPHSPAALHEPDAPTSEPESIPEAASIPESPADLEPSADIHSPQADGTPEEADDDSTVLPDEPPTDAEPTDEPEPN